MLYTILLVLTVQIPQYVTCVERVPLLVHQSRACNGYINLVGMFIPFTDGLTQTAADQISSLQNGPGPFGKHLFIQGFRHVHTCAYSYASRVGWARHRACQGERDRVREMYVRE